VKVEMSANQNKKYYIEGLSECLLNADPQQVCVKLELTEGDLVLATRKLF
jgi:hypothetical protein